MCIREIKQCKGTKKMGNIRKLTIALKYNKRQVSGY